MNGTLRIIKGIVFIAFGLYGLFFNPDMGPQFIIIFISLLIMSQAIEKLIINYKMKDFSEKLWVTITDNIISILIAVSLLYLVETDNINLLVQIIGSWLILKSIIGFFTTNKIMGDIKKYYNLFILVIGLVLIFIPDLITSISNLLIMLAIIIVGFFNIYIGHTLNKLFKGATDLRERMQIISRMNIFK